MSGELLFTKIVDQSVLYEGMSIPVSVQQLLYKTLGVSLERGDQIRIQIQIGDYVYDDAIIRNQSFDSGKYPNRSDIVQIRYSRQSLLAQRLRDVFKSTMLIVDEHLNGNENSKRNLSIPEKNREYVIVYVTKDMIWFDCIVRPEEDGKSFYEDDEEDLPQRREILSSSFKRNANVVENVKKRANGICQLCEQKAPFLDRQGNPYLEVHHVIWLSKGGADKVSNAVALCPNCHRKMHVINDEDDVKLLLEKAKWSK